MIGLRRWYLVLIERVSTVLLVMLVLVALLTYVVPVISVEHAFLVTLAAFLVEVLLVIPVVLAIRRTVQEYRGHA